VTYIGQWSRFLCAVQYITTKECSFCYCRVGVIRHTVLVDCLQSRHCLIIGVCVCITELLRSLFDVLYDEEIISEETFRRWQGSSDPAEQAGKGVAVRSVQQFFTWLDGSVTS